MDEEKTLFDDAVQDSYDASDRPFDFVGLGNETALICEGDPSLKEKIRATLAEMGYQLTEAPSAKDALRNMRFHVYDLVLVNGNFDSGQEDSPGVSGILSYLANLPMAIRRQIFIVLIGENYRTMDNMTAFNKSADLVVNPKNIEDIGTIVKKGIDDNAAFYHVFMESLKKMGRV
jgi:DNA-binding response OmpR family regulator